MLILDVKTRWSSTHQMMSTCPAKSSWLVIDISTLKVAPSSIGLRLASSLLRIVICMMLN
jgi:hypothetical protein